MKTGVNTFGITDNGMYVFVPILKVWVLLLTFGSIGWWTSKVSGAVCTGIYLTPLITTGLTV